MIEQHYFEGGLTDTPEIRFTKDGRGVTSFTLAQSDSRKNDAGEWETTANLYLRVTLWDTDRHTWTDTLAGLQKGTKLVVRGKLVTNKWQDKEGNNRSQIEVQAFHAYIDAAAGAPAAGNTQTNFNTGRSVNIQGNNNTGWAVQDTRGGFSQQQQTQQGWGEPAAPANNDDNPPF